MARIETINSSSKLTDRQREVIDHVMKGWSNREIAIYMKITDRAVEQHLTHIYRKLGIKPDSCRNKLITMMTLRSEESEPTD